MFEIGSKPRRRAETLVERLLDCHRRIRQMSELACEVATAVDPPAGELREAAARVARYFEQALPRHVADEAETITGRLRGREPELDRALEVMEAEHRDHEAPVARLIAACRRIEADPEGADRDGLAALAPKLRDDLEAHLEAEERVILPAIDRLIDADEQAAMLGELAARRDT